MVRPQLDATNPTNTTNPHKSTTHFLTAERLVKVAAKQEHMCH